MGLVKTRRLAAMQKQQRAKAGMKPSAKGEKEYPNTKQGKYLCRISHDSIEWICDPAGMVKV